MAIYSGISHWKWWFSIVMLVYQRVIFCWLWRLCLLSIEKKRKDYPSSRMMVPTSANSSPAVWHDWHGAISSWLRPWPTFSRNSPLIQIWKPRNKRTSDAKKAATRSFQSENFACWFQGKRPESLCIFQGEQRQSSWWCHGRSAATFLDPLQLLGEAMGIQDTGISELTFREYHELMGIYIYSH